MNQKTIYFEDDIVSVIEETTEEPELHGESILSQAGRFLFYIFAAILPFWFLPVTTDPIELNKTYFSAVLIIAALMLTIGGVLQDGRIRFLKARSFLIAILFAVVIFLSAIFAENPPSSLWGYGFEIGSVVNVILAVALLFTTPLILQSRKHIRNVFFALNIGIFVAALYFFVHSVFNVALFSWSNVSARSFNSFGSWSSLALLLGFGIAYLLPSFGGRSRLSIPLFFIFVLGAVLMNLNFVWILLGILSLLFVALALALREQRGRLFAVSLVLLLVSTLFLLLGTPLGQIFADNFDSFGRPNEVRPALDATFDIAKQVLASSPLFGSGSNTFGFQWEKFRNPSIVADPVFGLVRFNTGHNTILMFLIENGILGALSLVLFAALFIWNGLRVLGTSSGEGGLYVRSAFAGGLFLVLSWFLYPVNIALFLLTFLSVGLFYVSLREAGTLEPLVIHFFETKERGFVFSLLLIFLLVGGVAGMYYETTRYMGQISFARGIDLYNTTGEANAALIAVQRGIQFDSRQDRYYRMAAQLEYVKMQRALDRFSQGGISQQVMLDDFSSAYNAAHTDAEKAIELGKNDSQNYRILGQIYGLAIPFDKNTFTLATENFEKAKELSPSDPLILVDLARTYLALADVTILQGGGTTSRRIAGEHQEKAIEYLNKAIAQRPNLTQAHFTLSQLYAVRNQLPEAIARARSTIILAPHDIGAVFQLGFLLYQQQSYDEAQSVFEEVAARAPNHSNARYFLGLIYDRKGLREKALEQFEEVAVFNLKSGGRAEDVLNKPPPENRRSAPLEDTSPREIPTQ